MRSTNPTPRPVLMILLTIILASVASVSGFSGRNPFHIEKANQIIPSARISSLTLNAGLTRQNLRTNEENPSTSLQMVHQAERLETVRLDTSEAVVSEELVPKTLPDALRVFFLSPHSLGPTTVALILSFLLPWRISIAPVGLVDGIVFFGSIVFWFWQEHALHSKALHSEFDWYGKAIHQGHHENPYFHISIDPAPLMLSWLGIAHLVFRFFLPFPVACSATLGYASAGLFYEWAHFIVHTKVKPKSRFFKIMRDNHIRHHCVDQRYWFAFSLPQVDDFFGTNPDVQAVRRALKKQG